MVMQSEAFELSTLWTPGCSLERRTLVTGIHAGCGNVTTLIGRKGIDNSNPVS